MLITYIYHQLPLIYSCICYTIFRENTGLFAQKLYAFFNVVGGGGDVSKKEGPFDYGDDETSLIFIPFPLVSKLYMSVPLPNCTSFDLYR
jgi:hypothetical protein